MKVLFLDVDGVLNGGMTREVSPCGFTGVEQSKCERVRRIVKETGCDIVLSSTWRLLSSQVRYLWRELGSECELQWIGSTPCLDIRGGSGLYTAKVRGDEIQAWLDKTPADRFVILDDDDDMAHLMEHLVQTDGREGITDEIAGKVIERLNHP